MRPIALYHLHHPPVGTMEAPRVVARAFATYGVGDILGIMVIEDPDPKLIAEALKTLRGRAEALLDARGRTPVEALPAPGDVGRSRRALPWTRPEQEVAELEAWLGRIIQVQHPMYSLRELEAASQRLATEIGDDDAPAALACGRVAELLQALATWRALVERVRVHRASYEGRGRAS